MWVGILEPQTKFGHVLSNILEVPAIFVFTKEFPKNTKEKMPSSYFYSHFLQGGRINLIPSQDCCIFIAVSGDTHIVAIRGHKAIWQYGHIAIIWLYGHIAIWLYGIKAGQYGCFWKRQHKCSNLVKRLK
jgi:hypothetical protein